MHLVVRDFILAVEQDVIKKEKKAERHRGGVSVGLLFGEGLP